MTTEGQSEVMADLYLRMGGYRPQYGLPVGYSQQELRALVPFSVPLYDTPWSKGW